MKRFMPPWIMRTFYKTNSGARKTAVWRAGVLAAVFLFFAVALIALPEALLAQGTPPLPSGQAGADTFGLEPIGRGTTLATDDIRLIVARIIRAALGLLGIIALVIVIAAGYTIMTAGGDEQKITTGKMWLKNGVIGLAIILSAFSITHFIITRLGAATGSGPPLSGSGAPPPRQSFAGSGALGRIIKDHYPLRDQIDVARNTSIAVTFREAIDPASIIIDANRNGVLGDCLTPAAGQALNLSTDCDRANPAAVVLSATTTPNQPIDMTALAIAQGATGQFYTFVFQPLSLLGSEATDVGYIVDLKGTIKKADGRTGAFVNDRFGHYTWQFFTGTKIDTEAPTVASVYPAEGRTIPRNSILQINFSEPMHPSVTQGLINQTSAYYHMIFGNQNVSGEWWLTNGYKTAEFVSDAVCDPDPTKNLNSCGEPMYCLPVACAGANCSDSYLALVRTAVLQRAGSFQSVPFSGVMDMANNALDGDKDKDYDGKPQTPSNLRTINTDPATGELKADNFVWNFTVKNSIDTVAPYIEKVSPTPDEQNVDADALFKITFSKPMWLSTLVDGITVEEHPDLSTGRQPVAPVWFRHDASLDSSTQNPKTALRLWHRVFGPNNENAYYFTAVPNTVKSVTQNCLYPGVGPSGVAACDPATPSTCVPVNFNSQQDTGCVQTSDTGQQKQPDVATCLGKMRVWSPAN